jgi:hypothetical protein
VALLSGVDNIAYWSAWQDGLYTPGARIPLHEYVYSPAFAQVLWPASLLPWMVFRVLWIAASFAVTAWLLWPLGGVLRFVAIGVAWYFCMSAKADWLIALMLALGLRYPAAWAIGLLTKVTPGVGLLWFVLRREPRPLLIAAASTVAVIGVSALIAPHLWVDWAGVLVRSTGHTDSGWLFGVRTPPLLWRLPVALLLLVIGSFRGWLWTLPAAIVLAQPDLWTETFLVFAGLPRMAALRDEAAIGTLHAVRVAV